MSFFGSISAPTSRPCTAHVCFAQARTRPKYKPNLPCWQLLTRAAIAENPWPRSSRRCCLLTSEASVGPLSDLTPCVLAEKGGLGCCVLRVALAAGRAASRCWARCGRRRARPGRGRPGGGGVRAGLARQPGAAGEGRGGGERERGGPPLPAVSARSGVPPRLPPLARGAPVLPESPTSRSQRSLAPT